MSIKNWAFSILVMLFAVGASANTTGRILSSTATYPSGIYHNDGWTFPVSPLGVVTPVWDNGTFGTSLTVDCSTTADVLRPGGPGSSIEIDVTNNAGVGSGDIIAFNFEICASNPGAITTEITPYVKDLTNLQTYTPATSSGEFFVAGSNVNRRVHFASFPTGNAHATIVTVMVPKFPNGTRHKYVWGLSNSTSVGTTAKIYGVKVTADYNPWTPSGNGFTVSTLPNIQYNAEPTTNFVSTSVIGAVEPMTVQVQDVNDTVTGDFVIGTLKGTTFTSSFNTGDTVFFRINALGGTATHVFSHPVQVVFRSTSQTKVINVNLSQNVGGGGGVAPPTVTGFRGFHDTASQIRLSWDVSLNAADYRIIRSADGINFFDLNRHVSGTVFVDTNAPNSQPWTYKILAQNNSGSSLPTIEFCAQTTATTGPC